MVENELKYTEDQRREYLNMIDRVGRNWLEVFDGDSDFYSAAFWDLLTGIWKQGGEARKTDATRLMLGIKSAQTASKYLETAIERRLLLEKENPKDARSRLVALTAEMKSKLDLFFDKAVTELKVASEQVKAKEPLSVETRPPV